jgi:predicted HTH transcriptional regulator
MPEGGVSGRMPVFRRMLSCAARVAAIKAFKAEHPDMSNRMIAKIFDVDERTIGRDLES